MARFRRGGDTIGALDGGIVEHVGVSGAVVEAAVAFEGEGHRDRAVRAIKADGTRASIVETSLSPRREDVAICHHSLGGDDRFDNVGAVVANLPVETAVGKGKRYVPSLGAAVVDGRCVVGRGDGDKHRRDIDRVH